MATVQPLPFAAVGGPANAVTATRALLAGVVAVLVVASWTDAVTTAPVVALSSLALALDGVDGWLARRTGTVTAFGARFDMEVDAFLLLVLSALVATQVGAWVLLVGLARYLLLGAERVWPWLARPVAPRRWRKAVAALQGVALVVAAAGVLPVAATTTLLLVALVLLAWSFGTQVLEVRR